MAVLVSCVPVSQQYLPFSLGKKGWKEYSKINKFLCVVPYLAVVN